MKCKKFMLFQEKLQAHFLLVHISIFLILCIFMVSSICFINKSRAADKADSYKYYTSLEIKNGDTLWSIASEYGTIEYDNLQEFVEEVKVLNDLKGDTIHSGQFLIIPYYSNESK